MSIDDWRYSDQKMKVREQALKVLLSKFGGQMEGVRPKYSVNQSMSVLKTGCLKATCTLAGIVKYYEAYYAKGN